MAGLSPARCMALSVAGRRRAIGTVAGAGADAHLFNLLLCHLAHHGHLNADFLSQVAGSPPTARLAAPNLPP